MEVKLTNTFVSNIRSNCTKIWKKADVQSHFLDAVFVSIILEQGALAWVTHMSCEK